MSDDLHPELITTHARLEEVEAQWNALHDKCATATAFESHALISSYWRNFGDADSLRVCALWSGHDLAAVAPLRLAAGHRLTPTTGGLSDFSDVLIDEGERTAIALATALLDIPGQDRLDWPEVRPGAALPALIDAWPGQCVSVPASACFDLPAESLENFVERLPAKRRRDARTKLRRIETYGFADEPVGSDPDDVTAAVRQLLELHARQWRGRPINPEHLSARFADHLAETARQLVPKGQVIITRHRVGDGYAMSLFITGPNFLGGYLYGVDPDLGSGIDRSLLTLRIGLEAAAGFARFNFLRGDENGKSRWRPRELRNRRVIMLRPGLSVGHLAAGYTVARHSAAQRVKSSPRLMRIASKIYPK